MREKRVLQAASVLYACKLGSTFTIPSFEAFPDWPKTYSVRDGQRNLALLTIPNMLTGGVYNIITLSVKATGGTRTCRTIRPYNYNIAFTRSRTHGASQTSEHHLINELSD